MNILVINADDVLKPEEVGAELPHLPDIVFSSPADPAPGIARTVTTDLGTPVFVRDALGLGPDGESDAELKKRVLLFISEIEERWAGREALVVTHSAVVAKMHDLFSCDEVPAAHNGPFHDFEIF